MRVVLIIIYLICFTHLRDFCIFWAQRAK